MNHIYAHHDTYGTPAQFSDDEDDDDRAATGRMTLAGRNSTLELHER
jgi:hypothetical protein